MRTGKLAKLVSPAIDRYHVRMNFTSCTPRHGTTWFVSRHPGAIEWAKRRGLIVDRWVEHLEPEKVGENDTIIGTLPVNLAAKVCELGARYLHLSLLLPADWRGQELSADELMATHAELRAFRVQGEK